MRVLSIFICGVILLGSCEPQVNKSPKRADQTQKPDSYYQEKHRPQFHFSPEANWMNDPNGMVYYQGEYHLFYQYYPDSTVWGPMHWGHAVSSDMVEWKHLPIALYPDSLGYIFSGSAVVDWNNTSGFGTDGKPPLIAIFTHHLIEGERAGTTDFQYQSIAYSNDLGRTWTKYQGNPVLPNSEKIKDFRDPKVIWHTASKQWVMVFAAYDHVKLYGSPDLKAWTHLSDFGEEFGNHEGVWECPDLFPLKVEGTQDEKWVLLQSINPGGPNGGSATQYFVGDFDGQKFVLDKAFENQLKKQSAFWMDYGRDNYAGVTWSDVPAEDGRKLMLGWMSNWDYAQIVPTEKWRSAMTVPRELKLIKNGSSFLLISEPVKELQTLRTTQVAIAKQTVEGPFDLKSLGDFNCQQLELDLIIDLKNSTSENLVIRLENGLNEKYDLKIDLKNNSLISDRTAAGQHGFSEKFAREVHLAPFQKKSELLALKAFIDHSSVEIFLNGGELVMTELLFPTELFNRLTLIPDSGALQLESGAIYSLKGVWQN